MTGNLELNGNWISNDGENERDSDSGPGGAVLIGTTDPTFGITFDPNVRNLTVTGSGSE